MGVLSSISNFLISLSNGDIIQVIIASFMLVGIIVTVHYSYKTNKITKEEKKLQLCVDLMSEERQVFFQLKSQKLSDKEYNYLLFSFFEQASLLFLHEKIDKKLFVDYFKYKIAKVYDWFIETETFDEPIDRIKEYPNFCILAGNAGKDIVGDIKKLMKPPQIIRVRKK